MNIVLSSYSMLLMLQAKQNIILNLKRLVWVIILEYQYRICYKKKEKRKEKPMREIRLIFL